MEASDFVKACEFVEACDFVKACEFEKLESLSRKASEFQIESFEGDF